MSIADPSSPGRDPIDVRRAIYERFPSPPLAYSIDGLSVSVSGPLDLGSLVGDLVVADRGDVLVVMQLESLRVVERDPIELELGDIASVAGAVRARSKPLLRALEGEARVLGCTEPSGGFRAGRVDPFHEMTMRAATAEEALAARSAITGGSGPWVGTTLDSTGLEVRLKATGFTRHTFLCGQSGSGKTYTTGVVLEALRLATELPMIVLDPNSDHVRLGELCVAPSSSSDAREYTAIDPPLIARGRGRGGVVDLVAHLSDLSPEMLAAVIGLDPIRDLDEYAALRVSFADLAAPFSPDDLGRRAQALSSDGARLATRLANLGIADWDLWCRPGETSIVGGRLATHPMTVIDLGSLPRAVERSLVSTVVLRTLWARREERTPRLVVVDEAHNVFPAHPDSALLEVSTALGTVIAAEGRKFGIHLLVATQRPGKVHEQVVSQCDNLVLLRMNSRSDVNDLVSLFSHVPSGLIQRSPSLTLGEVLYAGPIAPVPVFAKTRTRLTHEGGADLPTAWATRTRNDQV